MANIVIFGIGQIAEVAKVYIDRFSDDHVVGFTVDREFATVESFHGLPVVPWEDLETRFPPDAVRLLGPLSYQRLNDLRRERHAEGKARGYGFATFVHPSVHNLADTIGENCFILENCTLQPFVRIGDGVIIWSTSHIGHHCVIEDFCFLSSLVGLASGVRIGSGSMLGGQVGVDNGISVGANSYLESRVMLRRDVPSGSVVRHAYDTPEPYTSDRLKAMKFK